VENGATAKPEYKEKVRYKLRRVKPRHKVLVQEDLGDRVVQTIMEWPILGTRVETKTIPKKPTGEWRTVAKISRLRFVKSKDTERIFIYDKFTGQFIDELQEHDIMGLVQALLQELGAFQVWSKGLRKLKDGRKRRHFRIVVVGKLEAKILEALGVSEVRAPHGGEHFEPESG
jgi:hypothetical protein